MNQAMRQLLIWKLCWMQRARNHCFRGILARAGSPGIHNNRAGAEAAASAPSAAANRHVLNGSIVAVLNGVSHPETIRSARNPVIDSRTFRSEELALSRRQSPPVQPVTPSI